MRACAAVLLVLFAGCESETLEDAASLESRLLAPCCYRQTLDVHSSEPASALRYEIRERMASGETAVDVETSLVDRYGDRIRAIPRRNFLDPFGTLGLGAVAMALIVVALVGNRLRRLDERPATRAAVQLIGENDRRKLAAELAELDR